MPCQKWSDKLGVRKNDCKRAFSIMYTTLAHQFYFDSRKRQNLGLGGLTYEIKVCSLPRNRPVRCFGYKI